MVDKLFGLQVLKALNFEVLFVEITLKKAADLSRSAIDAANAIKVNPTIAISIYTPRSASEIVEAAREQIANSIDTITELLKVGHSIRALIKAKNTEIGIDERLNRRAYLDALEKRLTTILNQAGITPVGDFDEDEVSDEIATVEGQIAALKATDNRYHSSVSAKVMDSVMIERIRDTLNQIKRDKAELRDELAGLNLNARIKLDPSDVAVLKKHKILV